MYLEKSILIEFLIEKLVEKNVKNPGHSVRVPDTKLVTDGARGWLRSIRSLLSSNALRSNPVSSIVNKFVIKTRRNATQVHEHSDR